MHSALRRFIHEVAGVALASLIPVILTAFLSIPFNLGAHPGEPRVPTPGLDRHMS
jgi:hypothetical protein